MRKKTLQKISNLLYPSSWVWCKGWFVYDFIFITFHFLKNYLHASNDGKMLSYIAYTQEPSHSYVDHPFENNWYFFHGLAGHSSPKYNFKSTLFEKPPKFIAFPNIGTQFPIYSQYGLTFNGALSFSFFPRYTNHLMGKQGATPSYLRWNQTLSIGYQISNYLLPYLFLGFQTYTLKVKKINIFNKNTGIYDQEGKQFTFGVGTSFPIANINVSTSITRRYLDININTNKTSLSSFITEPIAQSKYTYNAKLTYAPQEWSWCFQYNQVYIPKMLFYPIIAAIYKIKLT